MQIGKSCHWFTGHSRWPTRYTLSAPPSPDIIILCWYYYWHTLFFRTCMGPTTAVMILDRTRVIKLLQSMPVYAAPVMFLHVSWLTRSFPLSFPLSQVVAAHMMDDAQGPVSCGTQAFNPPQRRATIKIDATTINHNLDNKRSRYSGTMPAFEKL